MAHGLIGMARLSGEIAIVTGAARGIGAETARVLAREGAAVAVTARRLGEADRLAKEIADAGGRAIAVACDVGDGRSVHQAVEETVRMLGSPTILVNNAGQIAPIGRLVDIKPHEWAAVINVNLVGAAAMARAVLLHMLKEGRGAIVNISTGAAHRAMEGWSAYCSSKAGLAMLTKSLALEYGPLGVRVFGFAPGIVDTEMQASIRASGVGSISKLPRNMLASPSEPATAIAFLCSSDGASLAGQELDIRNAEFRAAAGLKPLPA
jgi:NAD(P)-dependent dehydrogenase (short-subunit alcohol dehydrogenase family)